MKRAQKATDDGNFRSAKSMAVTALLSGEIELIDKDGNVSSEKMEYWGEGTMYYYTASGHFAKLDVFNGTRDDIAPVYARYTAEPGDPGYLISGGLYTGFEEEHVTGAMLVFYVEANSSGGAADNSIAFNDYYQLFMETDSMVLLWMDLGL